LNAKRNAFTSWTDIWHAVLGFTCSALRHLPGLWKLLSLTVALIFVVYEALQAEDRVTSYEDLLEFTIGFILGVILLP
jgi:hypothetical protein